MPEYQIFTPGEYFPWEKDEVDRLIKLQADNYGVIPKEPPDMPAMFRSHPYTLAEVSAFNRMWDPYNPLFNDREYAIKAGYKDLPAFPGFVNIGAKGNGFFDKRIGDGFYYTNDGRDLTYKRPVTVGDHLTMQGNWPEFKEVTIPGSTLRQWVAGGEAYLGDPEGNEVVRGVGNTRDCYIKFTDGTPHKDFSANMAEWCEYFPAPHYTTDDEWDYIRELWSKEVIRGADTLYYEDVDVGYMPPATCSGPVTYMNMIEWYGARGLSRQQLCNKKELETTFRDSNGNYLFETCIHLGNRNLPNGRMLWFNDTGARLVARTVTNFIGDAGYVTRFCWRFFPFFKELRDYQPYDYDLITRVVPGYENRPLNRHGSEGDTVIGKAYVYGKHIDDDGRHIIDICAWGETLDGDIVQVCPMAACLPSREDK